MAADGDGFLTVAVIAGAHGINGEVRLNCFAEDPASLKGFEGLRLKGGEPVRITALKTSGKSLVARFDGVTDRNAAEALKGTELLLPRVSLPELEDGEVYHADLIGLSVKLVSGRDLGEVVAVHNFGAGDLIEVRVEETGKTVLLPFDRESVPEIDFEAGKLLADPPDGLIED